MSNRNVRSYHKELTDKKNKIVNDLSAVANLTDKKNDILNLIAQYEMVNEEITDLLNKEIYDLKNEKESMEFDHEEKIDELQEKIDELQEKIDTTSFPILSLEDEMKLELFNAASYKYTLAQLEERLGNRFQLM